MRADQEQILADVLQLADELAALFVPGVSGGKVTLTPELAAFVALESGLFGSLRSVRAALRDGRVQDLVTAERTIGEIHKRVVIGLANPALAVRFGRDEPFASKAIDDMYEKELRRRGTPRTDQQRVRDAKSFDQESAILHGRQIGLQYMVVEDPSGTATVTRVPRGESLPSRGRDLALHAISLTAETVELLVPPILHALVVDDDEWRRRYESFARRLGTFAKPYVTAHKLREKTPDRTIEVDARGQIRVDGQVVDPAALRAPCTPRPEPSK